MFFWFDISIQTHDDVNSSSISQNKQNTNTYLQKPDGVNNVDLQTLQNATKRSLSAFFPFFNISSGRRKTFWRGVRLTDKYHQLTESEQHTLLTA